MLTHALYIIDFPVDRLISEQGDKILSVRYGSTDTVSYRNSFAVLKLSRPAACMIDVLIINKNFHRVFIFYGSSCSAAYCSISIYEY